MSDHTYCVDCGFKFRPGEKTIYHPDASGNNDTCSTHEKCPTYNVRVNIKKAIVEKEKELEILYKELVKNG